MIQRRRALVSNRNFFLFAFNFLLSNLVHIVSSFEISTVPSKNQYTVHFLSTVETQNILLQKCCPFSEVLSKDGHCIPTPSDFQPVVPLSLEKRFKRALQNTLGHNIENETLESYNEEDAFVLRFKFARPMCNKGVLRRMLYNSPAAIQLTSSLQFVANKFLNDGKEAENHSLILDTNNYCIDYRESDAGILIEFCVPENVEKFLPEKSVPKKRHNKNYSSRPSTPPQEASSLPPLLLRKCCQPSHVMDMINFACVRHEIPWQLSPIQSSEIMNPLQYQSHLYQSTWNSDNFTNSSAENAGNEEANRAPLLVSWLTGTPDCKHSYEVYIGEYDRYYVNSDGVLITEQNGTIAKTPKTEYCLEAVVIYNQDYEDASDNNNNTALSRDDKFTNIFSKQMAMVCFENNMEAAGFLEEKKNRRTLYAVLTGISSVFLLATCMVYTLLRKELKLPGWLQFAYSVALLLTFSLLTVAQLWTQAIHDISKSLCRALGYGLHFSFLVCFFYLTSMNFEIYSSFRSLALAHGFGKSRGKRRFLEFTAFSIGVPTAITALLLAVDSCNPDDTKLEGSLCILPTTGIGVESCVFDSRHKVAQLHYFYGFVGILLMINLVIFVCTLVSLRNRERETRMAKRQSTSTCDYDRLQLFTRLFLIFGITWVFEVISWLFQYFEVDDSIQDIFIVTDCLNASQGFAVFLMFVCKRQTWKQLKKKFNAAFGIQGSRPLCRPHFNGTVSSSNMTNGTSLKSSHLSSTKSRDSASMRLAAATTTTVAPAPSLSPGVLNETVDKRSPLKSET